MEGEYVEKSEFTENEEAEVLSNSVLNTSSETLKTSEEQELDHNQVNDSSVPTESNNCEAPSNDVVMNGEGVTTSESVISPDDFVDEPNASGAEVVPSEVVEGVEAELKDQVVVGVANDTNVEEKFPSKEESAMSPDDFVAEPKGSGAEVVPSEVVEEVETENQDHVKVEVSNDIKAEEKFPPKEEFVIVSPDDLVSESNGSGIDVSPSEAVGVEAELEDEVKVGVADDINIEEELPSKEEFVIVSPDDLVSESNGSGTEVVPSEAVEGVVTEIQDQVEVELADDIYTEEEFPSKEKSVISPDDVVAESHGSGTDVSPSEAVGVEAELKDQVEVGVADDINAKEEFPSKEYKMDDVQVPAEDIATPIVQEVSAPDTRVENHSAVEGYGAAEPAADDVFENSAQQPTDAVSGDAIKKDDDDLEMKVVEVDLSQQTVSGEVSKCPELFDAAFQSLEVQEAEDAKPTDSPKAATASEVFHEEQKLEQQEQEKKIEDENSMSPMARLGTDYASLARSQSTDSNASEGRLSQEPVNRTQVEKVAAPEIAKNVRMMFETGQIQDLHEVKKTVASIDEPIGSGVFENEPVQLEGVVRSGEYVNDVDALQKGQTKNLLNQWKDKGKEEFKADKKPINMAEDEGRMLENEPVRRNDVVREEDADDAKDLPSKGQAKILTQQWISRKDDFLKEQKPIKLFENETEPSVVENQPEVRMDVLREDDNLEEIWLRKGFTKDLAGYWAGPKEEVRAAREVIDLGQEKDGVIAENQPTKLEGVIRADDLAEEVLPIEKGRAKTMVSRWLTMPEEAAKQPFQLDVNTHEAGVYENEPIQLEGVVKCTAQVDDVLGQKGMIKNISGRFIQQEEEPRSRKEMIVIDKAEGPSILENDPEPVRADVVRSEYGSDEHQVEKGTTKNLVHIWKTQDLTSPRPNMDRTDPSWILQGAEKAAESGVFENQPQARADVFREMAYEPEVISVAETRNMRALWSKMGQDDGQKPAKGPELVRFTPPRELTPPRVNQEEFKSYQALTLSSETFTACGPSPSAANTNTRSAAQPRSPVYSPGGSSYAAQSPSGDQTLKSSAQFVLKSS